MNILSLFDGMSCGQIALNRAGLEYDNYFASEIDKYAIAVTQANYPNTKQLGDITQIKGADLPRIDLLIGGSPCQGFSFAGKQLNFEDPRSKLFFEYARLKEELNPAFFLLENVKMKKESQGVISKYLGVEPIEINSALVSAQNRKRLYWTNIPGIEQPEDKGVLLKDILETHGTGVLKNKGELKEKTDKSNCIDANYFKGVDNHGQRTQVRSGPSTRFTPNYLQYDVNGKGYGSQDQRAFYLEGKHGTLGTNAHSCAKVLLLDKSKLVRSSARGKIVKDFSIRKLTPIECERLQTVPDNYTNHVSNTQRYKMLGNGWTVDVITHILKEIAFL